MCGRYTLFARPRSVAEAFRLDEPTLFDARYNIAPTQDVLAVRRDERGRRAAAPLRWGLVPAWASDPGIGVKAINARAETVTEKPMFRAAFKARRCLIPASGFFEWKADGKKKQPYFIHPAEGELFAFAGLWELWAKGPEPVESCAIITTEANAATRALHDRMPVILSPADFTDWLDPHTPPPALLELLRPCPAEAVAAFPVGTRVNSVRNDDPGCVTPLTGLPLA